MTKKNYARTFGQDLMRGEHIVGQKTKKQPQHVDGLLMNSDSGNDPAYYFKKQQAEKTAGRPLTTEEFQRDWYEGPDSYQTGTSIFDPVVCELAYTWFTKPGAAVLDPFAGGSVRGIVATYLGRNYTGIDLREEQIYANEIQGQQIMGATAPDTYQIKISAKSARQPFNGCDPDYIRDVCHASCCQSSAAPTGTMITIHPTEEAAIEARGGIIIDGLLQPKPGERKCPFKTEDHLCGIHFTDDKPFGCIASPFTLNKNGTLIVRNRYRMLKCYNDGEKIPAYKAFRASLDLILGADEAERICQHLDDGGGDTMATITRENYDMIMENDAIKHGGNANEKGIINWIAGDSLEMDALLPQGEEYDFVFTCPPYADLEVYSDDPRDISTMDYPDFLQVYRDIISKAVARLRDDRFACVVVGEVRDKKGNYYNFIGDTIQAFRDAGCHYYNESILVTAVGSLPIRAGRQFDAGRKIGKTHQNVLVFVKGDGKKAAKWCGPIEIAFEVETGGSE